jgi:hypothetical protein
MKSLLIFSSLFYTAAALAQGTSLCSSVIIQSPVVEKPQEVAVVSSTCSTVVLGWQGSSGQSYLISGVYRDGETGVVLDSTEVVSSYSCDGAFHCQATLPVSRGSTLSFSVVAIGVVNGQTLQSYPARPEGYFSIAACRTTGARTTETARVSAPVTEDKLSLSNEQLLTFPNPVGSIVNIRWSSEYRGSAILSIVDGTGKALKIQNIQKDKVDYVAQLPAKGLPSGLYYVEIQTTKGKMVVARFVKN